MTLDAAWSLHAHADSVTALLTLLFALSPDLSDIMKQDMERFAARQQAAAASSKSSSTQQQVRGCARVLTSAGTHAVAVTRLSRL